MKKFNFMEIGIKEKHTTFPSVNKIKLYFSPSPVFSIPTVSAQNNWKRYVDYKNGVAMFEKVGEREKPKLNFQLSITSNMVALMGWRKFVIQGKHEMWVYRYMPNKDKIYVFQSKELLIPLRKMEEGKKVKKS